MRSRKQLIIGFIWVFLLLGVARSEQEIPATLDLETALQLALTQNRNLVRSGFAIRKGEVSLVGSKGAFATFVKPDTSLGVRDGQDIWQYGLVGSRKFLPGTEIELRGNVKRYSNDDSDDLRRATVKCEVRQPLFRNFGSLIHGEGMRDAESQLREISRGYEQQKADLVIQVVRTYENIMRLQSQVVSDETYFERMEKLYKLTKARERQGHTTRVDTLRVELQRGQALDRLETSRERLFSDQRELAELLGFVPETSFALEPPPQLELELPEMEEAVRIALANRLDYAQVIEHHKDSLRKVRIAKRGMLPEFRLVSNYERYGEGEEYDDAWRLNEDEWFVGITADTDLNKIQQKTSLSQASLNAGAAEESIRIKEWSIAREVQQQMAAYHRSQAEVGIAERNRKLAESRAKLAQRLFEIGRGDNFSATDAAQAYFLAQTRLLAARADASISGYKLLHVLGTLLESPPALKPHFRQDGQD